MLGWPGTVMLRVGPRKVLVRDGDTVLGTHRFHGFRLVAGQPRRRRGARRRAASPPDGPPVGQPDAGPVRGAVRRVARGLRDGAGPRRARGAAGAGRDGLAVRADERDRRAAGLPTPVGTRPRAVHLQHGWSSPRPRRRARCCGELVAQAVGFVPTFLAAAASCWRARSPSRSGPSPDVAHLDRDPAVYWRDPDLAYEPDPRVGPVMVVTRYVVPPDGRGAVPQGDGARAARAAADRGDRAATSTATGPTPSVFLMVASLLAPGRTTCVSTPAGSPARSDRSQHEELAHSFAVEVTVRTSSRRPATGGHGLRASQPRGCCRPG